jgi:hypothetical protein
MAMQRWGLTARGLAAASIAFSLWFAAATAAAAMGMGDGGGSSGGGGGGGGGGGNGGDAGSGRDRVNTPPSICAKGQIYDLKRSKCVKAERNLLYGAYAATPAPALVKDRRLNGAPSALDSPDVANSVRALPDRGSCGATSRQ